MGRDIADLINARGFQCDCGCYHSANLEKLIIESGALKRLPDLVGQYGGKKVFIVTDGNEYTAAGRNVCEILEQAGILYSIYIFEQNHLEPDEQAVGSVVMHYDSDCNLILGVGSGVINDIGKILASVTGNTYFIAATAPSMDGYASATSSMVVRRQSQYEQKCKVEIVNIQQIESCSHESSWTRSTKRCLDVPKCHYRSKVRVDII